MPTSSPLRGEPSFLVPEIVDAATRREFLAMMAAAGLLAACGDSGANGGATAPKTRDFVDVTGTPVKVPDQAKRIVATNDQNAGAQLLSLGAPVVGIASRDGVLDPSIAAYFDAEDIELVGEHFEPNVEAIVALRPDLIVHEGYEGKVTLPGEAMEQLQKVAPVVGIDVFRPIDEVMADFAELLGGGATARLDQQKAELAEATEELRAVLGDRWSEVSASFLISSGGTLEAWGPTTLGATNLLDGLGVTWVPIMLEAEKPENGGYLAELSEERLPEFSADLVMVDVSFGGEVILDHPLFKALPATGAGQVIEFDTSELTDTHYPGTVAIARYLTEQVAAMDLRTDLV